MTSRVNSNPEPPPSSEELLERLREESFQVGHDGISQHINGDENNSDS
jgi:hypothetical protein